MNIRIVFGERQPWEFGNNSNAPFLGKVLQLFPLQDGARFEIEAPAEVDVEAQAFIGQVNAFAERGLVYRLNSARQTEWWQLVTHFRYLAATKRVGCSEREAEDLDFEIIAEHVAAAYKAGGIEKAEVIVRFSYDSFTMGIHA